MARSILFALLLLVPLSAACQVPVASTATPIGASPAEGTDGGIGASRAVPTASSITGSPAAPRASASPSDADVTDVTLVLDWVPNTNHTGIFVAEERGYFADAGLAVQIIQPGEVMAPQAVVSQAADFGIDFQEQLTIARADGLPLVAVGAVLQHNTSGFATLSEIGAASPRDWEGLRYGAFGSPFEEPTVRSLMDCADGDFSQLETVNTGMVDSLALLAGGQIDLAWIFYGWQGIQADLQGINLDVVMMEDYVDCVPDYYSPIVIASEETIDERPEIVRAFVGALSRGYADAISDPETAAGALLRAAPELDPDLVYQSQAWVSPRYQSEAPRWGEQSPEVWEAYARWMVEAGVIDAMIDVDGAFTNEFLPVEGQ